MISTRKHQGSGKFTTTKTCEKRFVKVHSCQRYMLKWENRNIYRANFQLWVKKAFCYCCKV